MAAKTANARRDALNVNEYRLKLIDAGMGAEQAKRPQQRAARFMATPEAKRAEPSPIEGFQSVGAIVGRSAPAAKRTGSAEGAAAKSRPSSGARPSPARSPPHSKNKLLDVGAEIAGTRQDEYGEFMSFTHAVLCQVGLPRAKTDAREFMRKSGDAWVNVQAGWLDEGKGQQQPTPLRGYAASGAGLGVVLRQTLRHPRNSHCGRQCRRVLAPYGHGERGPPLYDLAQANARACRLPLAAWFQGPHVQRPASRAVRRMAQ